MDDLKLAQDMAKYAAQGIKTLESSVEMTNSFVKYFTELLKDQEARRQLLEFYNAGLKQEEKVKKGEKLEILSYSIDPAYAKQLYRICERDHIAIVKAQCNVFDPVMDGKGDNIRTVKDSVWIYNTQQKGFNYAVAEAKARSGCEIEIPMEVARQFVQKVKNEMNPMLQITGMSLEKYIMLRQDIRKLDEDLKFTLFPRFYEKDGRDMVDVGFLSRTEVRYDKRGNFFEEQETYQISEIMKGLLAKQKMMDLVNSFSDSRILVLDNTDNLDATAFRLLMDFVTNGEITELYDNILICCVEHEDILDVVKDYEVDYMYFE